MIEHADQLPDGFWDAIIAGEQDPFDVGDDRTEWRGKEFHTVLGTDVHVGLTLADVEVGEHRFQVVGVGGVIVTHSRRGEGLLRPTLEAALERAASLGPDKAMLFCSEANARIYERFGFTEVHALIVAGGQRMRERFMWRPLRDGATWPDGPVNLPQLPF